MTPEQQRGAVEADTINRAFGLVNATAEALAPIVHANLLSYINRRLGEMPRVKVVLSDLNCTIIQLEGVVVEKGRDTAEYTRTYLPTIFLNNQGFWIVPGTFFHEVFENNQHYASSVIMPDWPERRLVPKNEWPQLAVHALNIIDLLADERKRSNNGGPVQTAFSVTA